MQRALEALHAFLVAFDNRFHPAVRQVPGVPGEILGACLVLGEKPEADSLHAPRDQKTSSDDHGVAAVPDGAVESVIGSSFLPRSSLLNAPTSVFTAASRRASC